MVALWRIVTILTGFLAACFAATAVGIFSLEAMDLLRYPSKEFAARATLAWTHINFFFPLMALFAAVPSLIVIGWAEQERVRSLRPYAWAGGIVGLIILVLLLPETSADLLSAFLLVPFVLIGGMAAGIVYWAIAGRNAGQWRREQVQ